MIEASLGLAVVAATPLLFAALGELLGERVGLLNAGVEGVMLMGAVIGYIVAVNTSSIPLGLAGAAATGGVFNLVSYGLPVILMRSSQILVSFAVWFIGAGLSAEIGVSYTTRHLDVALADTPVPGLRTIPVIGSVLFEQPWLFYVGTLLIIATAVILNYTSHGLNIRAIGEDPASAHAAGIPVRAWQTFYVGIGGALMGIGGGSLSLVVTQTWNEQMTAGRGFIAFALVIFAGWRPLGLLWGSVLFGLLLISGDIGQSQGWSIPSSFLSMLPYVSTVLILVVRTWREVGRSGRTLAPAALGSTFVRGDR